VDEKRASTRGSQGLGLSLRNPFVVCAGIVVADLFVPPLPSLPAAGELRVTGDFLLAPGGCAANTAIVLSRLAVGSAVVGKVGEDLFGDFLEEDLSRRGIDTRGVGRSSTHATSQTVALTVDGEDRRFVHTLGANADFAVGGIDRSLVEDADAFYVYAREGARVARSEIMDDGRVVDLDVEGRLIGIEILDASSNGVRLADLADRFGLPDRRAGLEALERLFRSTETA